jgi:SAM-dependent methyltransferase
MRARSRGRLARIQATLACPGCHGDLTYSEHQARCVRCDTGYPIRDGRFYFVDVPARNDDFDRVKGWLKRVLGRTYYTVGIHLFAPTFPLNFARVVTRHVDPASALVVDAGSGNYRLHPDIISVDMFDYEAVDIVCVLEALPFRSGAIDAVVSRSVLEHVPDPARVVREFHRCTRSGGLGIHVIPFLFPVHSSPVDYHRFTPDGHDILFADWERVSRTNPTGPVTVLLVHIIEVLSTILSLGLPRLKSLSYLFLCGVMFPLKFMDVVFINRPAFMTSAASVLSVVRKTSE